MKDSASHGRRKCSIQHILRSFRRYDVGWENSAGSREVFGAGAVSPLLVKTLGRSVDGDVI